METRKNRYAKYRRDIKAMPDDSSYFLRPTREDREALSLASPAENVASFDASEFDSDGKGNTPPYEVYLRHRRIAVIAKLIVLVALVAIFVVWFYLLLGRSHA